jgi:EAL domain-containing protein (putative c-di-GMP-specific phosphodiesterase class I)
MTSPTAEQALHGGPRRIVELAARALGYEAGRAALVEGNLLRTVATAGQVSNEAERMLRNMALSVVDGEAMASDDAVGVPLRTQGGKVVGTLCVAGGGSAREELEPLEVLEAFASVLADQLELLKHVSRMETDHNASDELSRAISDGQLRPWYQPVLRLETRELVGFEALVRWHRPTGQVERPAGFIGLAEQSGLVTRLDMSVLDQACADLARWREVRPDLRLNVNFSGRHLDDGRWVEDVHERVTRAGVPPQNLDIELTETARPADVVRGTRQLQTLRDLGYTLWFDDFGTGWSELQHLVQLPVDGIKIDRFFADALGSRADAIVKALVLAARELGLSTTIEGISRPEHAERAQELGCEYAQGYLWSQPLPASEVDERLTSDDFALGG